MHMLRPRIGTIDTCSAKAKRKTADPFYLSREWREFVERLIEQRFGNRSGARCEDAACKHLIAAASASLPTM
jgi:hypothetical protein